MSPYSFLVQFPIWVPGLYFGTGTCRSRGEDAPSLVETLEQEAAASARTRIEFGCDSLLKERAAVRNKYQRKDRKSNHKFEVVGGQELMVRVPLPLAEVWAEMRAQVEQLTGQAGLQILRAILENEVTHRVGPPHRPNPSAGCVRWGKQPGYVVFAGQKIPLERPRVRTREGQEVELQSYGQLQEDGKLQRAVRDRMVAGLSTRNYLRAVESVVEGYGIEKSSVSRQFVEASSNQLRALCERRLEALVCSGSLQQASNTVD